MSLPCLSHLRPGSASVPPPSDAARADRARGLSAEPVVGVSFENRGDQGERGLTGTRWHSKNAQERLLGQRLSNSPASSASVIAWLATPAGLGGFPENRSEHPCNGCRIIPEQRFTKPEGGA